MKVRADTIGDLVCGEERGFGGRRGDSVVAVAREGRRRSVEEGPVFCSCLQGVLAVGWRICGSEYINYLRN